MSPDKNNLSDSRGSAPGIAFFKILLRLLGVNRAAEFVWAVAFFYALFDRKAADAASAYLKHRFPEAGRLKRFYCRWALFTSQGQALLEAFASRLGNMLQWEYETPDTFSALDAGEHRGFILLLSHFGPWQALIQELNIATRPVNLLVTPDQNRNVEKTLASNRLKIPWRSISTRSPMGGLPEACEAIEQGEIVCIMGDRCHEQKGVRVPFLGEEAEFPIAAFYLAARCQCPIQVLSAVRRKRHRILGIRHGPVIRPIMQGRDRNSLLPFLRIYVSELEFLARQHPFQLFLFEDPWSRKGQKAPLRFRP